jgi:hypothetical protein
LAAVFENPVRYRKVRWEGFGRVVNMWGGGFNEMRFSCLVPPLISHDPPHPHPSLKQDLSRTLPPIKATEEGGDILYGPHRVRGKDGPLDLSVAEALRGARTSSAVKGPPRYSDKYIGAK